MIPNPVEGLPPHRPPHPGRRPRAFTTDLYTVAPPVRGFLLRFRNIGRYENRVTSASCFRSFGNRDRSPPYTVISSDNTPLSVFYFYFVCVFFSQRIIHVFRCRTELLYTKNRIVLFRKPELCSASGLFPHPPSFLSDCRPFADTSCPFILIIIVYGSSSRCQPDFRRSSHGAAIFPHFHILFFFRRASFAKILPSRGVEPVRNDKKPRLPDDPADGAFSQIVSICDSILFSITSYTVP